jgi:hypothetical protein
MSLLPPVVPTPLYFDRYVPCQILFVVANELVREQKMDWYEAYREALDFQQSLSRRVAPLSYGAKPGEVNWTEFVCMANRYAHLDMPGRVQVRQQLEQGQALWMLPTMLAEPDLCSRSALDDEDYLPVPGCLSKQTGFGLAAMGGAIGAMVSAVLAARLFSGE